MNQNFNTPIAFMIFNRPEYTKKVFSEIRKAQPKQLFIIADGPRTPSETPLCEETRAVVADIDWPCEVHRNYAEKNIGLKERFHTGLNWFFENVEEGIILEDDCVPHQSFFRFTGEMLEKYKNQKNIMMISGNNFLPEIKTNDSYFFSQYFSIWGWATWKRAWKRYDVNMKSWEQSSNKKRLEKIYQPKYMFKYMSNIFDKVYSGKINTWDFQWFYTCLINNGLCIIPGVNLVSNIGITGTNANSNSYGRNQNLSTFDVYNNSLLKHPAHIYQNKKYDNTFYEINFKRSFFKKIISKIVSALIKYNPLRK